MKYSINLLFAALYLSLTLTSCFEDSCEGTREFVRFDPIWLTEAQIRTTPTFSSTRPLENPGKIYLYNQYLMINEQGVGIHVYDNSNQKDPVQIGFIAIPGNFDLAVKDNILYADNVMDIISLDISDIESPQLVHRVEDAFQHWDNNGSYIAYYENTDVVQSFDCNNSDVANGATRFLVDNVLFDATSSEVVVPASGGGQQSGVTGTGGSTARFTIVQDYLYTVDESKLSTWYIDGFIDFRNASEIGWGVETIFPYHDNLFIGTNTGMHIYDNSNPEAPVRLSTFEHARACDPVVVEGDKAYVTLRNGSRCQSFTNQLDIIDISNLLRPQLIKTHQMDNPHGLSIRNNHLYLCEGNFGLKVFDVENSQNIDRLAHLDQVVAHDVIALSNETLLMIGSEGFYQFDVSDPANPEQLSLIKTQN